MKKAFYLLLSIIIFLSGFPVYARIDMPETIRIGLYSDNSAIASIPITSTQSIEVGFTEDNKFVSLMRYEDAQTLTVSKDAHFIKTGNLLVEYNPSDKNLPAGEKYGPYHVRIGESYNDIDSVNEMMEQLKEKRIAAYPVYTGNWEIWHGQFTDAASTKKAISDVLEKKIGEGFCKPLSGSQHTIKILDSDNNIKMAFNIEGIGLTLRAVSKTDEPGILNINGKPFRGDLEFMRIESSDMTIINVLPLEHYLYGVVPREMSAAAPLEALKAQAVTARTYTLRSMGRHSNRHFDLCASDHCQVYGGYEWEKFKSNLAVDQTAGKLLTYKGALAGTYYYSSNGGMTEDVKNVWGSEIPYLISVKDDYETPDSYNYTWQIQHSSAKIKEMLKNWRKGSIDIGDIIGMRIAETAPSGRVTKLIVQGRKDNAGFLIENARTIFYLNSQMYVISTDADVSVRKNDEEAVTTQLAGLKVATAKGISTIGSTAKDVVIKDGSGECKTVKTVPATYTFTGRGWGHAVGMSQNGAKGMADAGLSYEQILKHYYPGTEIQ